MINVSAVCIFGKPTVPSALVAFFFCTNNSLNNILFLQNNSITVVQPSFSWANQVLNNSSVLCGEKYPQHSATESSFPHKQNNLTQVCGSTSSTCVSTFEMNQDGAHTQDGVSYDQQSVHFIKIFCCHCSLTEVKGIILI